MKIKKPKRIMSLFLAALMCVTSLVGIGTTAYAAEETDDVYLISYPRDGDSNYNAEWGHSNLSLMNGWKTGTSRYTTVRAMGSYNGNICYCIETVSYTHLDVYKRQSSKIKDITIYSFLT